MGTTSSVVEINGQQYDAVTGQLIGAVKKVAHHVKNQTRPAVIDGFMRGPRVHKAEAKKTDEKGSKPAGKKPLYEARKLHRRPERSKTLIRNSVKKPYAADESPIKTRRFSLDPAKEHRAKSIGKNTYVKRFGIISSHSKSSASKAEEGEIVSRPPSAVALHTTGGHSATSAVPPLPSMITSASHQHIERLLDQALTRAGEHKKALQTKSPWQRVKLMPKWLSIGLALLICIAIAAVIVWNYMPRVAIKAVDMRAGIGAKAPAYVPAGYQFKGPVHYAAGEVSMEYKSPTGGSFTLNQKSSNWDSASLAANMLTKEQQIQTSQVNGTTVYIYGSHNEAAWVSNGILYSLKDSAQSTDTQATKVEAKTPAPSLSSDQVLRIVQSF